MYLLTFTFKEDGGIFGEQWAAWEEAKDLIEQYQGSIERNSVHGNQWIISFTMDSHQYDSLLQGTEWTTLCNQYKDFFASITLESTPE